MSAPRPQLYGLRLRHVVIAIVAILVALALVLNYTLW